MVMVTVARRGDPKNLTVCLLAFFFCRLVFWSQTLGPAAGRSMDRQLMHGLFLQSHPTKVSKIVDVMFQRGLIVREGSRSDLSTCSVDVAVVLVV